ncbi:MAG: ECF-type sigma factor [Planctomycetota bacterium]
MSDQHHSVRFPTTCWSQLAVGSAGAERTAFELLAQRYWRPIEAYLRQALRRRAESHDLTQEFFLWMIETGFLAKADLSRGRFRAFIKVALRNYVADHDRERRTRKRGGARAAVSLEHDGSALDR